jgi:hypothetical protein
VQALPLGRDDLDMPLRRLADDAVAGAGCATREHGDQAAGDAITLLNRASQSRLVLAASAQREERAVLLLRVLLRM